MKQELRDQQFKKYCETGQELFHRKNIQYADSIRFMGLVGAVANLVGAVMRLPALVLTDPHHGKTHTEKLTDILIDIHNYANIALMMIEDDNFSGELVEFVEGRQ